VATGHTASDQAETVLLHLVRGAGLTGLAGIAPSSRWPAPGHDALALVRPLLGLSHAETLAYCAAAGLQPLDDESNRSPTFLRNRLRHELLPALRDYNPRIDDALARLASAVRADLDYLEGVASIAVQDGYDGSVGLSRAVIESLAPSLRRHAFRLALQRLAGDLQGYSERHIIALERLAADGRTGDALDLPRGVAAELTRDRIELRTAAVASAVALPPEPAVLDVPGETCFGPLIVAAGSAALDGSTSVDVDAEAAGANLCVRRRRAGDRFQPLGLSQPKKLQDFFVDAHVRRSERDSVPVFESEHGIVWVGGLRIADWARPRPGQPLLRLSYRRAAAP
jgi:tRNA(Ile)-lysidine synthase